MDRQSQSSVTEGSHNDLIENKIKEFIDSVIQMQTEFQRINSIQDDQITFIFGKTGSAKSTLANLFAGKVLSTKFEGGRWKFSGENLATDIGNKPVSATTFPIRIEDSLDHSTLRDFVGFFDTRGTAMEIASCLFLKDLIDSCKKFRIILTIEENNVTGKSSDLVPMVRHLQGLFTDEKKLLEGLLVVVTKIPLPHGEERIGIDTIQKNLQEIVEEDKTLDKLTKTILTKIAEQPEKICLFYKPERAGEVNSSAIKDIRAKLDNISHIDNQDINITVSDSGKVHLVLFVKHLREKLDQGVDMLLERINKVKEAKMLSECPFDKLDFLKTLLLKIMPLEENLGDDSTGEIQYFKKLAIFAENITKDDKEFLDGITIKKLSEYICLLIELFPGTKIDTGKWRLQFEKLITESHSLMSELLKNEIDSQINKIIQKTEEVIKKLIEASSSFKEFTTCRDRITDHLPSHQTDDDPLRYLANLKKFIKDTNLKVCNQYGDVKRLSEEDISKLTDFYIWISQLKYKIRNENKISPYNYHENIINLQIQLNNISCQTFVQQDGIIKVSSRILELSSIESFLSVPNLKTVEIYSPCAVFVENVNIRKSGLNLVIVSPLLKIIGASTIDISGDDMLDLTEEPDNGSLEGLPGKPGGNGGHFLGICQKIMNGKDLIIKANGGRGGPGGDGKKGITGETGYDGSKEFIIARHRICLKSRRLEERRNAASFLRGLLTLNGTIIEEFESEGHAGETGGPGGRPGIGGKGGNPGTIRMKPFELKNAINVEENQGKRGVNGNPGEGGEGGDGGITYYGVYSEEFILPQFRRRYLNLVNYNPPMLAQVPFLANMSHYIPGVITGVITGIISMPTKVSFGLLAGKMVLSGISALRNTCWKEEPHPKTIYGQIVRGSTGEQGPAGEGVNEEHIESPERNFYEFDIALIRSFYQRYCKEVGHENPATQRLEF